MILQDIITKKKLVVTPTQSKGGGYDIWISPSSFLYSHLKDDPTLLVDRVFQEINKENRDMELQQTFVKVIRCLPKWIKPTKRGQLPDLLYQAVLLETIGTTLEAVEELQKYNEKDSGL